MLDAYPQQCNSLCLYSQWIYVQNNVGYLYNLW
jgi:hypothetical protein